MVDDAYWGFSSEAFSQLLIQMHCTDIQLSHFLKWWFAKYLADTSTVTLISAHVLSTFKTLSGLRKNHPLWNRRVMGQGSGANSAKYPFSSFRYRSSRSLGGKMRSRAFSKARVRLPSHPKSAVNDQGRCGSIPKHAYNRLPEELSFVWSWIHDATESDLMLAYAASIAEKRILCRWRDKLKWLRKSVIVVLRNNRIHFIAQMWGFSSAHAGYRLETVLAPVMLHRICSQFRATVNAHV